MTSGDLFQPIPSQLYLKATWNVKREPLEKSTYNFSRTPNCVLSRTTSLSKRCYLQNQKNWLRASMEDGFVSPWSQSNFHEKHFFERFDAQPTQQYGSLTDYVFLCFLLSWIVVDTLKVSLPLPHSTWSLVSAVMVQVKSKDSFFQILSQP